MSDGEEASRMNSSARQSSLRGNGLAILDVEGELDISETQLHPWIRQLDESKPQKCFEYFNITIII